MQLVARGRALMVCLGLALALSACDDGTSAEAQHLQRAQEYAVAGDAAAAIIELKNALGENPENAAARAMLGELYLRSGDPVSAIKELERAREMGTANDKLKLLLVQARLQTREFEAIIDDVAADQQPTDDTGAELLALRGQALFEMGRFEEANLALGRVAGTHPVPAAYAGLAKLALFRNDPTAAERYIGVGLTKFPDSGALKLLQGEQQMLARQFEAAQATFDALLKAEPGNLLAGLGLVRAELALGKTEPARVVIDDFLERDPKNLALILLRGVAGLQARDYAAAQQDANTALAADDSNTVALYVAGAASYALEQYEQSLRALTRYVAAVPADPAGRKLLAAAQVRMGDPQAAQRTLGNNTNVQDPQYLALMSSASALSGNIDEGMRYLEQAIVQSPENARLRTQLGMMRIAAGDPIQGEADLDQALGLDPSLADDPRYNRAEIALIEGYLRQREFDKALSAIEEWQKKHPEDATGYVMAGVAHASKGDSEKAREAFGKALELKPGAPDASANLAVLELQANNPKGAELVLQQVLPHHPDDLKTLVLLAQLAAREGDRPKTRDWLEKAVAAHPDSLPTRIVLSRLYFDLHEPAKTLEMIAPVARAMPDNPSVLEVKARAEMELGRLDDSIATYESIVTRFPGAVQSQYELSQAYMARGDLEKARAAAEAAIAAEPRHASAKLQLARILIRQGDTAAAEGVVADLAGIYPDATDIKEIQGDLALLKGDPQRALGFFREARQTSDSARLAAAEARALAAGGDAGAATAVLEQWVERNPQDTAVRLELNRYYHLEKRTADAEANLRTVIGYDPDNWVARNDLAWLLYQKGDLSAARPEAEQARELAPSNPVVLDTLGVILLEQGEVEPATALIRQASTSAPDNPDIGFHLAQAYAQGDHKDQAKELLTALLEKHPAFSERERAAALLAELGG